jgi:hypothetical protein
MYHIHRHTDDLVTLMSRAVSKFGTAERKYSVRFTASGPVITVTVDDADEKLVAQVWKSNDEIKIEKPARS